MASLVSSYPRSVCLVNTYYPPYKSATGMFASHFAKYLMENGIDVHICSQKEDYRSKGKTLVPSGTLHYVRRISFGNLKYFRLFSAFINSFLLIHKSRKLACSFTIVLTDPPFLNLWASIFYKRQKWANWTMDLYPDAFVSNTLVSPKNFLYRAYRKLLKSSPPNFLICLGKAQANYLKKIYYPTTTCFAFPVGVRDYDIKQDKTPIWFEDSTKIYFGYMGNMGEAHDSQRILNFVKALDPLQHKFVVSCYGSKSKCFLESIKNLDVVEHVSFLSDFELNHIDIQLVSLYPTWTHMCVPSKAFTSLSHGSAILFLGSEDSDVWKYISVAGWNLPENRSVSDFLLFLNKESLSQKKQKALDLSKELTLMQKEEYQKIVEEIRKRIDE